MKLKKIIFILIFPIFLTSCWDSVQIDKRIFVTLIGFDLGKDANSKEFANLKENDPFVPRDINKYEIFFSYPVISSFSLQNGGQLSNKTIKTEASCMEDALTKALLVSSRFISFQKVDFLLFSEDLMKDKQNFKELIVYFEREAEFSRNINIAISEGDVENFINFSPPEHENNIENYISGLIKNNYFNSIISEVTINKLILATNNGGAFIAPKIKISDTGKELTIDGVYLLKDFEIVDELSIEEVSDLGALTNKLGVMTKKIFKKGHTLSYEVSNLKRKFKIKSKKDDDKLKLDINIKARGVLRGGYYDDVIIDQINEIEENINESLQKEFNELVKSIQVEKKMDLIGLNIYLKKFHPIIWNKYQDNWDETFQNAEINVNVDVDLIRTGLLK